MKIPSAMYVTSSSELRKWYEKNYLKEPEMWLVFPNKASGKPRITYNDAVEAALCYGWIDSIVRKHDAESSMQRFSPRRAGSSYSQPNIERLRKLAGEHKLKPQVQKSVEQTLKREFTFPADITKAIKANEITWKNYQNFSPAYKRIRVAFVEAARNRPEVFKKRLNHFLAMTKKNKMFGFGGIDAYF